MHIRISLGTKFQLRLTVLTFWVKFAQKGCFRSKTENLAHIKLFCMGADRQNGICNKTRQSRVRRLLMRVKVRKVRKVRKARKLRINDG